MRPVTLNKMIPPTVREFLPKNENGKYSRNEIEKVMVQFAKLHVKEALKQASEKVVVDYTLLEDYNKTLLVDENIEVYAITSSILDSYSLDNIK